MVIKTLIRVMIIIVVVVKVSIRKMIQVKTIILIQNLNSNNSINKIYKICKMMKREIKEGILKRKINNKILKSRQELRKN